MSYDAEKAGVVAAFSEESVRRGFIKKVDRLSTIITKNKWPGFLFRSTPYSQFNSWSPLAQWHYSTNVLTSEMFSWHVEEILVTADHTARSQMMHGLRSLRCLPSLGCSSFWPWYVWRLSESKCQSTSSSCSPVRYIDLTYRLSIYRHFWKISISIRQFWKISISISISIRQFQKYRYRYRYRYGDFGKYRYRYRYR